MPADNPEQFYTGRSADFSETRIRDAALLADQGNGDLAENLHIFETPEGIVVYAATDRGIGQNENHDRVVINPNTSQFTVLDGMASAEPSQILAEKILAYPNDLTKAIEEARSVMRARQIYHGTCLISAELTPDKTLNVSQSGDCGLIAFGSDGKVKFSATRQVKMHTLPLKVDMKDFGIQRTYQRLVDTSPVSFISVSSGDLHDYDEVKLAEGDTVILFSDALWSNFSTDELSALVAQNRNPQDLFRRISEDLNRKMQSAATPLLSKDDVFSSVEEKARCYYGGDHVPHSDNQSLVLPRV